MSQFVPWTICAARRRPSDGRPLKIDLQRPAVSPATPAPPRSPRPDRALQGSPPVSFSRQVRPVRTGLDFKLPAGCSTPVLPSQALPGRVAVGDVNNPVSPPGVPPGPPAKQRITLCVQVCWPLLGSASSEGSSHERRPVLS